MTTILRKLLLGVTALVALTAPATLTTMTVISSAAAQVNLIGTEYEGDLIVPGWESQGGGLMTDPIWYHTFKRADEARLVLIQWALPRRPGSSHTPFRVTDVLLIQPIARDLVLTFDCDPPRTNLSERIFAVVRLDVRQRWWRDVRKAWKVEVATGIRRR